MRIFNRIFVMGLLVASVSACVDDYNDANPQPLRDAPVIRVSASGSNSIIVATPADRFTNTYEAFALYDGPTTFTVSVISAPGGIGEVSVEGSVPDFGTVTLDESSVAAIQGAESGTFNFTFTPNPDMEADEERSLNITIDVSDNQVSEDGEEASKTTTLVLPVTLVPGCLSTAVEAGTYRVTSATGNLDGGEAYNLDDLKAGGSVNNVFIEIEQERPGLITISDVTASLWPTFYPTRAVPEVTVGVCGNDIEGSFVVGGLRNFTVDGTVNGDGTITISWSYVRADATPTPTDPATGTYTLEKF